MANEPACPPSASVPTHPPIDPGHASGSRAPRGAAGRTGRPAFRELLEAMDRARSPSAAEARARLATSERVEGRSPRREPEPRTARDRSHEPERPGLDGVASSSVPLPVEPGEAATEASHRATTEALHERTVRAMQVGRTADGDPVARLRIALGRGAEGVEVRLVHDAAGVHATLRADDPRLARAFAARVQREFDGAGVVGTPIEVET